MKLQALFFIIQFVFLGQAGSQTLAQSADLFPMGESDKWIYESYFKPYAGPAEYFSEIKSIIGDSTINGKDYQIVRVTVVKDSLVDYTLEFWRYDSLKFYYYAPGSAYSGGEEMLYDGEILADTTWWWSQTSWKFVKLLTENWFGQSRQVQFWDKGSDFHGSVWMRCSKLARDVGITWLYYTQGRTPSQTYDSNLVGATLSGASPGKPAPPLGIRVQYNEANALIKWRRNGENDLLRYRLYLVSPTDSLILVDSTAVPDTTFRLINLPLNREIDFYLTAVDSNLNESPVSRRLRVILRDSTTALAAETFPLPGQFELQQNFPNPFNPATTIRFNLWHAGQVDLTIYDITGRLVRQLLAQTRVSGEHAVEWNGRDDGGRLVQSGVYLYRLQAGEAVQTRKMLLVR